MVTSKDRFVVQACWTISEQSCLKLQVSKDKTLARYLELRFEGPDLKRKKVIHRGYWQYIKYSESGRPRIRRAGGSWIYLDKFVFKKVEYGVPNKRPEPPKHIKYV